MAKMTISDMKRKARNCNDVAQRMRRAGDGALERKDSMEAIRCFIIADADSTRATICEVGAAILEELEGITAILEKHTLGGLKPTGHPPTM